MLYLLKQGQDDKRELATDLAYSRSANARLTAAIDCGGEIPERGTFGADGTTGCAIDKAESTDRDDPEGAHPFEHSGIEEQGGERNRCEGEYRFVGMDCGFGSGLN